MLYLQLCFALCSKTCSMQFRIVYLIRIIWTTERRGGFIWVWMGGWVGLPSCMYSTYIPEMSSVCWVPTLTLSWYGFTLKSNEFLEWVMALSRMFHYSVHQSVWKTSLKYRSSTLCFLISSHSPLLISHMIIHIISIHFLCSFHCPENWYHLVH